MNVQHKPNFDRVLDRAIARAFALLVHIWPADSRDWALAMQAELFELNTSQESLAWLAGGIMSLGKAWWNQAVYGWRSDEAEPSAVATPGPVAFALVVAALAAFFLWPSAHEGFSAVLHSWHRDNGQSYGLSLQKMAQKAEAEHDATSLTFTAEWGGSFEEFARRQDEAVAMDPSLTWIYIRGGGGYYGISQKHGWAKKLEAWDPDNAVPYLVEASIRETEIRRDAGNTFAKEKALNDPVWRADMEKAFAAPRYDSYFDRAIDLHRAFLSKHNIYDPEIVRTVVLHIYAPGLGESQWYSKLLLDQAKEAQQKGDTSTAIHLAWTVAQFGERLRANSTFDIVRATAEGMLQPAYQFLQPLEAAAGHTEVAKFLANQNEAFARKAAEKQPARMPWMPGSSRPLDATIIALHAASLGVILFGGMMVFSALYLLAGRFAPGLRIGGAYRWACNCGRFAPAGLAAAVALLATAFAPYHEEVQAYFVAGAKDEATLHQLASMADSLGTVPYWILGTVGNQHVLFWEGLLAAAVIIGTLVLCRSALFGRAPRTRIA